MKYKILEINQKEQRLVARSARDGNGENFKFMQMLSVDIKNVLPKLVVNGLVIIRKAEKNNIIELHEV